MHKTAVLVAFSCVFLCLQDSSCEGNGLDAALRRDFRNFFETRQVGRLLQNVAKELDLGNVFNDVKHSNSWPESRLNLFCITCAAGVNEILQLNYTEEIVNRTIELCIELGIGNDVVCEGIIRPDAAVFLYIVENSPDETGSDICGFIFIKRGCTTNNPDRIWEVSLPNVTKPPIDEPPYPQPGVATLKVLHLSDTHYDPEYFPGADVNCAEKYLCCKEVNGIPDDPKFAAGFWGDYRGCDLPKWTIELLYDHIATNNPDIDFIIYTGDLVPGNVWSTSREGNLAIINEAFDLVMKYFPGIPVYPAVGNHEAHPVNLFPQPYIDDPEFDISWLYDELSSIWQNWLPAEAANSVAYGAYYSAQIRPGLRILSINTQYCYPMNWWLVLDSTDIANQLTLVAQELQNAEDVGDRVYIIGHIPSGSGDCSFTWSHQFNRVVSRYENTVVGIFYGHVHKDTFEIFFDPEDKSRAYEIAYIGQSSTPGSDINPGYKIYTIEGDFEGSRYRVLDHENYILDLTVANALNITSIVKLYSAKDAYGLADLSPQTWSDFVFQMNESNSTLFDVFYRNYVKAGTPSMLRGCDDNCKNGLLCNLLLSDNSDHSKCKELDALY